MDFFQHLRNKYMYDKLVPEKDRSRSKPTPLGKVTWIFVPNVSVTSQSQVWPLSRSASPQVLTSPLAKYEDSESQCCKCKIRFTTGIILLTQGLTEIPYVQHSAQHLMKQPITIVMMI